MSKIFSLFSGFQLSRILVVALMSVLMLFSTACSRANATDTATLKNSNSSSPNPPGQVQPYKGGMNNFDDVDTVRFDKGSVDAKAKALRDKVERNINQKGIDSPEQYVKNYRSGTPLNKRIENIGDDLGQSAEEAKESLKHFGKSGSENLERNVKGLPEEASRTLEQAKQNAKAASENISSGVEEPLNKAGKALNRAGEFAQDKADDTADAARRMVN